MLGIGNGFQAYEIRRRTPDDAVPARNALCGKEGRRIKAERPHAMIDEIANCRAQFRLPFRRDPKSRLEVLQRSTVVAPFPGSVRRLADAADCLAVVDTGDFAETAIGCLRTARVYDCEAIGCVRRTAFTSRREHDHRAALEYFKSGLQSAPERQTELLAAIGDFVYHRSGTLRLDAATCLAAQGIARWNGVIRGASTDFVRLESAADAEHEETIRANLAKKDLPDEYERRLRAILFARAKRNPKV